MHSTRFHPEHDHVRVAGRHSSHHGSCCTPETTPRAKGMTRVPRGGSLTKTVPGSERLNHDLSRELRRHLASQVSAGPQQVPQADTRRKQRTSRSAVARQLRVARVIDRQEAHRLQVLQAVNEERDAVTGLSSARRCTACTSTSSICSTAPAEARSDGEDNAWRLVCVRGSAE